MATSLSAASLESGDRLSRDEFHRRYCLRPDIKKAELVQGVVYVGGRVPFTTHAEPHAHVVGWLGSYAVFATGVRAGNSATIFLGTDTEVQPDGFLWRDPPPGAQAATLQPDHYLYGAPQLVVEVAASTASYDLHDKLRAYERAGVEEYIAWRVLDKAIDWFRLHEGRYRGVTPDEHGIIESAAFPGLKLHVAGMLAGDMQTVLHALKSDPS